MRQAIGLIAAAWGLLLLVRHLLATHLAIVNDGSPAPDLPRQIDDVTVAHAFYGQLGAGGSDYYGFTVAQPATTRFSLLIPQNHHAAGFRPLLRLSGPGLPSGTLELPSGDEGLHDGTTLYQRTQRIEPTLTPGTYLLEVVSERPGVYCFCCGVREPEHYADEAMYARVRELLDLPVS